MNYDIVIVSHEDDFYKIKYVVESACKYLDFDEIHIILSERKPFLEKNILSKISDRPIFYHNETEILEIDKSRVRWRPNWLYQMLLKIFQNVTKNDNFLVIESDVVINSKLDFFRDDKTVFYLGWDQHHKPYYNFNKKILGIGREYNYSFIVELMMYNKGIIKDMLEKANCNNIDDFLELVYQYQDKGCHMADYELYGNFCMKYYPDKYITEKINVRQNRKDGNWKISDIKRFMDMKQYKIVSFHSYKKIS